MVHLDHLNMLPGCPSTQLSYAPWHCSYRREALLAIGDFPENSAWVRTRSSTKNSSAVAIWRIERKTCSLSTTVLAGCPGVSCAITSSGGEGMGGSCGMGLRRDHHSSQA